MITVKDLAFYLIDKKEHYPISDEFMKLYRQSKDGYIDFARKTGHSIDLEKCEPNQKWHFFESWLLQSLQKGTICWHDSAQKAVIRIQCPELILWLIEAIGIDPTSVETASKIAEKGKKENLPPITIAKEIRAQVTWEAIEQALKL